MKDLIDYSRETRTGPMGKFSELSFICCLTLCEMLMFLPEVDGVSISTLAFIALGFIGT